MKPNDYINFKTILIKVIKEEEEERKFYFTKKFKSPSANMALSSNLNQYEIHSIRSDPKFSLLWVV